jgi:hypothetical protein
MTLFTIMVGEMFLEHWHRAGLGAAAARSEGDPRLPPRHPLWQLSLMQQLGLHQPLKLIRESTRRYVRTPTRLLRKETSNGRGIIGSGAIGTAFAGPLSLAGVEATISNSGGPGSLKDLVRELGPPIKAGHPRRSGSRRHRRGGRELDKAPGSDGRLPGWNGRIVIGLGSAAGNYAACRTCGTIDRVSRGREGWNAIRQCSSQ